MKIETIDLGFMGTEAIIASFLLMGEGSAAVIETGPTTCVENFMRGLKDNGVDPEDVRQVFVTHIHLDHSGASGHMPERAPNALFSVPHGAYWALGHPPQQRPPPPRGGGTPGGEVAERRLLRARGRLFASRGPVEAAEERGAYLR